MNKIVEDNYEVFKTSINRVLDDLYDVRDALNQANITSETNEKLKTLEQVAWNYELLRKKLINKEELSDFEMGEFKLIFDKIIRDWELQEERIARARKELKNLVVKI